MKMLAIISSHRKKGNTAGVISLLKKSIKNLANINNDTVDFETLFLKDYQIADCIGCRSCYHQGLRACPHQDDALLLKEKFKKSDVIIFAGPVYINSLNGTMKIFIDRFVHLCHHLEAYQQYAHIIITTNKSGISNTIKNLSDAVVAWGMYLTGSKGFALEDSTESEIDQLYHKEITKEAVKIFWDIKKQQNLKPKLAQLIVFKIHQYYKGNNKFKDLRPEEYQYFKEMGWANHKVNYYYPHQTNPIKILLARIVARIIILIMK
ncbi:MAG: flavodoxin family protein [Spirochaetes bacterium]|nr:flavodoxin family protein [Spirochaetota bacterium]